MSDPWRPYGAAHPYAPPRLLDVGVRAATLSVPGWPGDGPNAFLLWDDGAEEAVLVDGGWDHDAAHPVLRALVGAAGAARLRILATHGHPDHVGGAAWLARERGLSVEVAAEELPLARKFSGDVRLARLADGTPVGPPRLGLRVRRLAGHTPGSLVLVGPTLVLTGDLVLGRGSPWVGPPDGDLDAYLESLRWLAGLAGRRLLPGHGPAGGDAGAASRALLARRLAREQDILRLLAAGPRTPSELTAALYAARGEPRLLEPGSVAERTVLGHLARLHRLGRVEGPHDGLWRRV
jgi:ribonuclease/clavin/mitogillin